LFEGHPYGRTLSISDYDKVTNESLSDFHKKHLVVPNCELFVSGNYNEDLYDLLEQYFSTIPNKKSETIDFKKVITNQGGKHFFEKEDAIQSGIRIGKVLDVEFGSRAFFNLKILNTLFGGYFGSRLMKNIREDKGYTYGIGSGIASYEDATFFFITTEVGKDVTELAVKEIYKELEEITSKEVSAKELETVKNYMLGGLLKESDGVFSIADRFKGVYFQGETFEFYNRYIQAINEATTKDLLTTAQTYFNSTNMLEVIAGAK